MNDYVLETEWTLFQWLLLLICALATGPWLSISGLRLILDPSRVEDKSLANRIIRRVVAHNPWVRDSRLLAWMVFGEGILMDLVGILAMVTISRMFVE